MTFVVSVDITMSKTLYIEAESEEQAREIATCRVFNYAYDMAASADAYVSQEIVDIYPDD